jgi:hypothetical protein
MQPLEHEAMLRVFFGIKNEVFDCISVAGLVTLKLVNAKFPGSIERLVKLGNYSDGHSYIVVNRSAQSNLNNINSWNDNCLIIDPWYNIFISIADMKSKNSNLLLSHPLLDPQDKIVVMRITPENLPSGYSNYLQELSPLLKKLTMK